METLGRYLKAHREKSGMKLETVAYQTKVRLSLLQDLEADRLDRLPQGVFLRGYVRAYTDALKIGSDRALELLEQTFSPAVSPMSAMEASLAQAPESTSGSKFKWAALAIGLLLLGLAGAWWMNGSPDSKFDSVSSTQKTDVDVGTSRSLTPFNSASEE